MESRAGSDGLGRRSAQRYLIRLPVAYATEATGASGLLVDVSNSGARVEGLPPEVDLGATIEVELCTLPGAEPLIFPAKMARMCDGGFAVEFLERDPFLRAVLRLTRLAPGEQSLDADQRNQRAALLKQLAEL
jgi:hypothetical protein